MVKRNRNHSKNKLTSGSSQPKIIDETEKRLCVPAFFVNKNMLGETQDEKWKTSKAWREWGTENKALENLKQVFNREGEEDIPNQILNSLNAPLDNQGSDIVWKFGSSVKNETNKRSSESAYKIQSINNNGNSVNSNVIYDQNNKSRIQVDFDTHGRESGHWHSLVPGTFERKQGENHAFSWDTCPWIWLAIPEEYGMQPLVPISDRETKTNKNKNKKNVILDTKSKIITTPSRVAGEYSPKELDNANIAQLILIILWLVYEFLAKKNPARAIDFENVADAIKSNLDKKILFFKGGGMDTQEVIGHLQEQLDTHELIDQDSDDKSLEGNYDVDDLENSSDDEVAVDQITRKLK